MKWYSSFNSAVKLTMYELTLGAPLTIGWAIYRTPTGEWECVCDAFLVNHDVAMADILQIENAIKAYFPKAINFRNSSYSTSFAFDSSDEVVFRLQFCGPPVDFDTFW